MVLGMAPLMVQYAKWRSRALVPASVGLPIAAGTSLVFVKNAVLMTVYFHAAMGELANFMFVRGARVRQRQKLLRNFYIIELLSRLSTNLALPIRY